MLPFNHSYPGPLNHSPIRTLDGQTIGNVNSFGDVRDQLGRDTGHRIDGLGNICDPVGRPTGTYVDSVGIPRRLTDL